MGVDDNQPLNVGDLVMAKYPKLANDKWNSDRIVEYVKNELGGSGTFEDFCKAIEALRPSLVWLQEAPPKPLEFVKHTEKVSGAPLTRRSHVDMQEERAEKEKDKTEAKKKYDLEHPKNEDLYPTACYFPGTSRIDHSLTFFMRKEWTKRQEAKAAKLNLDPVPVAVFFTEGPNKGRIDHKKSAELLEAWRARHPVRE